MKRFVHGEDRSQCTLFPESLDEHIVENNPVRVIDVFIDELDLSQLGFLGTQPQVTGRPAYHPATLQKSTFMVTLIAFNQAAAWSGKRNAMWR